MAIAERELLRAERAFYRQALERIAADVDCLCDDMDDGEHYESCPYRIATEALL